MASRKVVTRSGKRLPKTQQFSFTKEMIPGFGTSNNGTASYRFNAWDNFDNLPMPTTSEEAWRRTDIKSLNTADFVIYHGDKQIDFPQPPEQLLNPLVGELQGPQLVLTPDRITRTGNLSELRDQGVIFTDLLNAEKENGELITSLRGQIVASNEGKFAALASAFADKGVLIYVPRYVQVSQPLHSVLWAPGTGLANFSHVIVWLEEGASLTYVHEAASPTESGQVLHAGIVEIRVGQGANLRFVELQSWGENVWNFSHERARVEQDGNLDWVLGAIGSHLTKDFSEIDLVGKGAVGKMSGFYFTDGNQHLDHDTQQNHRAPNTTSDLLFKGALKDNSRSVWQGMIYVAPGAQRTDGYQANRNLSLSPNARADSIPGLEILADDVRCTHGSTVGKIDPELVFYLQSRGLPQDVAERLVVEGFFDPVMQRIPFDGVRERLKTGIRNKMG